MALRTSWSASLASSCKCGLEENDDDVSKREDDHRFGVVGREAGREGGGDTASVVDAFCGWRVPPPNLGLCGWLCG